MVFGEHGLYSIQHETYCLESSWSLGHPRGNPDAQEAGKRRGAQDMAYSQGDLGLILGTGPGSIEGTQIPEPTLMSSRDRWQRSVPGTCYNTSLNSQEQTGSRRAGCLSFHLAGLGQVAGAGPIRLALLFGPSLSPQLFHCGGIQSHNLRAPPESQMHKSHTVCSCLPGSGTKRSLSAAF